MYYLVDAIMKIISNLASRSKNVYVFALDDIQMNAVTSKEKAQNKCIPSAKVEAKETVNLCYVNQPFSNVFSKLNLFSILFSPRRASKCTGSGSLLTSSWL